MKNDLKRSEATYNEQETTWKQPTTKQQTTWNDPQWVRRNLQRPKPTHNKQRKDMEMGVVCLVDNVWYTIEDFMFMRRMGSIDRNVLEGYL